MTEIINPNEEIRINDGSKVELHFSVAIENGAEIDNTPQADIGFDAPDDGECQHCSACRQCADSA